MEQERKCFYRKQIIPYIAVSIFALFIGGQITEGVLLVPYWKSLSATKFYSYYSQFGPTIGQFYTGLTIAAVLISFCLSIYCNAIKSNAVKYALISSFFSLLVILSFYVYFKPTNELFYKASLNESQLKKELVIWTYWHWARIILECLSLIFMILAIVKIQHEDRIKSQKESFDYE